MSDLQKHDRTQKAISMLHQGFRSPIVVIETAVSTSTVRSLAKTIHNGARQTSGSLPSSNYILYSMASLADASIFASVYRAMGGRKIFEDIDVDLLVQSRNIYLEVRKVDGVKDVEPLSINACWVLARDFRSGKAWIRQCKEDGGQYLLVDKQKVAAGCPFCAIRRSEKRKIKKAS